MAHRAAVYSVTINRKRHKDDVRLLGDIDNAGMWLGDAIQRYLAGGLPQATDDGLRHARCDAVSVDGDEVLTMFQHGQSGVTAEIMRGGAVRYRQELADTHQVRVASVFRLARAEKIGWWAVHVNNGRSAKSLAQRGLIEEFRAEFDDLTLVIAPCVDGAVLAEALRRGRLDEIRLHKYEQPSDRAAAATNRWVKTSDDAKLEVRLTSGKGRRLKPELLSRYIGGDDSLREEIFEFQGVVFDEVNLAVELDDGRQRSFNLERPNSGHAFTRDLTNLDLEDGEPTAESLHRELRDVLDDMT